MTQLQAPSLSDGLIKATELNDAPIVLVDMADNAGGVHLLIQLLFCKKFEPGSKRGCKLADRKIVALKSQHHFYAGLLLF